MRLDGGVLGNERNHLSENKLLLLRNAELDVRSCHYKALNAKNTVSFYIDVPILARPVQLPAGASQSPGNGQNAVVASASAHHSSSNKG
ncbi:hypothetical protein KRP22_004543 [Phytophthora ramorum]|nr:hypothetical protein KRP22_14292 [Phytophthora ramorum]